MAPKLEKEWQTQLESVEKRVMESIEKLDRKMTETTQLFGKVMKNIAKSN